MSDPEDPDAIISRTEGKAGPVEAYDDAIIGLDYLYEEAASGNRVAQSALLEIADLSIKLALKAREAGAKE